MRLTFKIKKVLKIFLGMQIAFFCYERPLLSSDIDVKSEVESIFKNTKFVEVRKFDVTDLYEVYFVRDKCKGIGVFFYSPSKKLVILGEVWSINGTSVTGKIIRDLEKKSEKNFFCDDFKN